MPNWTPSQLNAISLHGRTVLVSAAAGSGKTTTLTERIIRSLIGDGKGPGADLSRILVVTFTKSAAADLRAKISEALSRAISENPSRKHLVRQLLDLGSAQICTIDSFYLSHLRNHFSEAGLPPQFRMAEQAETESLAKETMEDLINEFYGKYGTIPGDAGLSALDGNPFEEALDQISPSKDRGDLVELLLATYTRLTAVPDGLSVFREAGHRLGEEAKEDFLATAPGAMFKEELTALLDSVVSFYEEALKKLGTDPALSNYAVSFGSERDCAVLFRDTLTSGTYEKFYKTVRAHQFEDLKRISMKCQTAIDLESLKKGRKKYLAMLKGIGDGWLVSAPEEIAVQMEKTSKVSSIIADFLIAFDERFIEEKRSRGICDFSDPRRKLLALLTDPDGSPSPLAVEIASKYDEIYIDEYQDVDAVQDRIFTLISRSNRFMVGDIKQSIYGFRGAEPSVFADYRRRLPLYPDDLNGSSEGSTVFMSENFRCDEPVIDFTNLVCSFAFRVCPGMEYKKEDDLIFAKGNKNGRLPDKVHIALVNRPALSQSKEADSPDEDDEPRGEPAWVAQKICELLKTCKKEDGETLKPSDVAILMRSSTQFRKFSDALRQAGIPVQSPKSDSPGDDPEMILLMRTLELIDNPQNDIALESVLSSLFGFTLEQLIAIRHAAGSAYSLSGALHRASEEEGPLAESCKTFLAWLDRWQKDSIAMPADLFIRLLWRDERLADIASGDAAATIYDYARSYQAIAYNGLYGFLNYFKRLLEDEKNLRLTTSAAENATGVSIRTIHDAKGLEFPVVFVCGLSEGVFPSRKCDTPEAMDEERRLAYVAMTRARERLYLSDAEGIDNDNLVKYPSRFIFDAGEENLEYAAPLPAELLEKTRRYIEADERRLQAISDLLSPGCRVRHAVFGEGLVLAVNLRD
ncbi:MAG: UvrD-helicase domain-containing protein, partial [Clostridia bacterium]|nr:UvrD-helicase domain-containing protein [Clostridia bacterium]